MVDFCGGVVFGSIVVGLGGSLDDGVKFEGWCYKDKGDVKDFRGHSGRLSALLHVSGNC